MTRSGTPPVKCMLESIQNMKHHIKTSFGISTITLSKRNTLIPYQGILQGNGASPTTWVIISTPLLNMLRAAGNGAKFESPLSHERTHLVGFAFVDDTDLVTFNMQRKDVKWNEIGTAMQEAIDRWEGGLKATGGAILPNKSWVYPIDFNFDNDGKAEYKTPEEIGHQFSVLDKDESRINLLTCTAGEGKETLGVVLAPNGNNEDAFKTLKKKAQTWRDHVRAGHLLPRLAWQAATTTIMKSLEYSLPALTLSEDQCNKLMGIVKEGLMPKAQLKNMPNAALYSPREEGGLQPPHLYITQGISHIEKFVQHIGSNSITGKLLRVSLEMSQLEIGIGRSLFSLQYKSFHILLEDSWIKNLWKFVWDNNIQIENRITKLPLPQREGDIFLMEAFQEQGYKPKELMILNRCRIYLRVMTLADIMTGEGNAFTEHYLCRREREQRNNYVWPNQDTPPQK